LNNIPESAHARRKCGSIFEESSAFRSYQQGKKIINALLTQPEEKRREIMSAIFVVCIVIVIIVLLLSVLTTSKAYSYKHTIDPLENNPHVSQKDKPDNTGN
jgi:uncharacterized membrane protein YvbJ